SPNRLSPVTYPLDVNAALASKPGHPLMHPSSLLSRRLVMQLGGFATGLRFGGDTEFLLRAVFLAKIVNLPEFAYFRRKRPHSLTTAVETGLGSKVRQQLLTTLKARYRDNLERVQKGVQPDLSPLVTAPAIQLQYLAGPESVFCAR
ncbi:MAG: hypothetical protein F6K03_02810, partial [Kamptonema sp. SIO4C4]|nr:hypothetical protein [Kamptonema sp. SIO4C4]